MYVRSTVVQFELNSRMSDAAAMMSTLQYVHATHYGQQLEVYYRFSISIIHNMIHVLYVVLYTYSHTVSHLDPGIVVVQFSILDV